MPDHDHIYRNEAEQYEEMISREDVGQNIFQAIRRIVPELGKVEALDMGAGTGRLTRMIAPHVKSILATDVSQAMLNETIEKLETLGLTNWRTQVADNRSLPLPDHSVDLVTAGWTICYLTSTNAPNWEANLEKIMGEMTRVLRPSGTAIILENFGTGVDHPHPPDFLTGYYHLLESRFGFSHDYVRTDFQFESAEEAERIIRFFFDGRLADRVASERLRVVPGCTGVWWKRFG